MGILDVFTGKPAKQAATQNAKLYNQFGSSGENILNQGQEQAQGYLGQAGQAYAPLNNLSNQYGQGTGMYMNALGLNGADGNANAVGAFHNAPGYQFARDEGLESVRRNAAANGMLGSGNTAVDMMRYATGFADQNYNNWLGQLSGFMGPQLQAAQGAAAGQAGMYGAQADLAQQAARDRIGINQTVLGGRTGANDARANASMQGSGNLWNAGMQLAGLGTGAYGSYQGDQQANAYLQRR